MREGTWWWACGGARAVRLDRGFTDECLTVADSGQTIPCRLASTSYRKAEWKADVDGCVARESDMCHPIGCII